MMNLNSAIEAVLFAAGDAVPVARLSLILGVEENEVLLAANELRDEYFRAERGLRILRLGDKLQMCSAPDYAPVITKVLEQRKPPMLSQSALETLAIVAYFQPVTRSYIDQVRGVDSSYTVGSLADRGLIEVCGRLDVPGRPALYRTTDAFLRTMGVSTLSELPPLPEVKGSEGAEKLRQTIDELKNAGNPDQLVMSELQGDQHRE